MADIKDLSKSLSDVKGNLDSTVKSLSDFGNKSATAEKQLANMNATASKAKGIFADFTKSITTSVTSLENLGQTVLSTFVGMKSIEKVIEYNKSLYDLSRTSQITGMSFKTLQTSLKDVEKGTFLSKQEAVNFFSTMQSGAPAIRLSGSEIAEVGRILTDEYGPSIDKAAEKLVNLQQKNIYLSKNILNNKDSINLTTDALARFVNGSYSAQDALDAIRLSSRATGDQQEQDQKRLQEIEKTHKNLTKTLDNFVLAIGEPLANVFREITPHVVDFFNMLNKQLQNPTVKFWIEKLTKGGMISTAISLSASAIPGFAALTAVGGALKLSIEMLVAKMTASTIAGGAGNAAGTAGAARGIGMGGIGAALTVGAAVGTWAGSAIGDNLDKWRGADQGTKTTGVMNRLEMTASYLGTLISGGSNKQAIMAANAGRFGYENNATSPEEALANAQKAGLKVYGAESTAGSLTKDLDQNKGPSKDETEAQKIIELIGMARQRFEVSNKIVDSQDKQIDQLIAIGGKEEDVKKLMDQNTQQLKSQLEAQKEVVAKSEELFNISDKIAKANKGSADEAKTEAALADAKAARDAARAVQKGIEVDIQNKGIRNQVREIEYLDKRSSLVDNEIAQVEAQRELSDTMLGGMGKSVEFRKQEIDLIEKKRKISQDEVAKLQELIEQRQKEGQGTLDLEAKIFAQKTAQINMTKKEVELTKSLRDGYLEALGSFNNAEGSFAKIITTREQGAGEAMRQFGAAQSMAMGGLGVGSKNPLARFHPDGSIDYASTKESQRVATDLYKNRPELQQRMKEFGIYKEGAGAASFNPRAEEQATALQNNTPANTTTGSNTNMWNRTGTSSEASGGGGISLTINVKGDTIESILKDVNKSLGDTLSKVMGGLGGSGRQFNLSSQ